MCPEVEGKELILDIKYERLPNICDFCGKLGHPDLKETVAQRMKMILMFMTLLMVTG